VGAQAQADDGGGCATEARIALLAAAGYATSMEDPETGELYWTLTPTCPPDLRDDIIRAVRRVQARPSPHSHRRPAPSQRTARALATFFAVLGVTSVGAGSLFAAGASRPAGGGVEGPANQVRPKAYATPDIGTASVGMVPADVPTTAPPTPMGRHRKPTTPPHVEHIAASAPVGRHRKVGHTDDSGDTQAKSSVQASQGPSGFQGHAVTAHAEQGRPSKRASDAPSPTEPPVGCEDQDPNAQDIG
jgi:hypothetical protein